MKSDSSSVNGLFHENRFLTTSGVLAGSASIRGRDRRTRLVVPPDRQGFGPSQRETSGTVPTPLPTGNTVERNVKEIYIATSAVAGTLSHSIPVVRVEDVGIRTRE